MTLNGFSCCILGGGIGGLATAIVLRRAGADVRVLEQAAEIKEVGAGLQISPNGFAVIDALKLGDALREVSVQGEAVRLRDYSGRNVLRLDLGRLQDQEYHFVHRADLLALLEQAAVAEGVTILLGQRASAVTSSTMSTVSTQTGEQYDADLIVGADGLHSVARMALNGVTAPFFTGQVAWRAVVPDDGAEPEAQVFMGPRRHIVTYPIRGGRFRNLVAVQERAAWQDESWSAKDDPRNLQSAFHDFGPEARALLAKVEEVHLWGLFRHPVASHWCQGGIVLVGDAAHPTLPFMAQGANMALEDAYGLGLCMKNAPHLSDALEKYQNLRMDRVRRVVDAASRNAWKYHLSFPPVRLAAHAALWLGGTLFPGRMMGQFDWLYGYDIRSEDG